MSPSNLHYDNLEIARVVFTSEITFGVGVENPSQGFSIVLHNFSTDCQINYFFPSYFHIFPFRRIHGESKETESVYSRKTYSLKQHIQQVSLSLKTDSSFFVRNGHKPESQSPVVNCHLVRCFIHANYLYLVCVSNLKPHKCVMSLKLLLFR